MRILRNTILALILSVGTASASEAPPRIANGTFWALGGALVAATAFDVETTVAALDKCAGRCKEGNPFAKEIVANGRPAMYAVALTGDALIMVGAYKLKEAGYSWWWALPTAGIVVHGLAGTMNLRFVF
mgnify:CR=1 FL=1